MFSVSVLREPVEMAGAVGNRTCADCEGSVWLCVFDRDDRFAGFGRRTGNQRSASGGPHWALIRLAFTNAFIGLAIDIQYRALKSSRLLIDHVDARTMQRFTRHVGFAVVGGDEHDCRCIVLRERVIGSPRAFHVRAEYAKILRDFGFADKAGEGAFPTFLCCIVGRRFDWLSLHHS